MKKYLLVFITGFLEQSLYTLYLLSVNHYLINLSSILMLIYMTIFVSLTAKIAKDKESIKLAFTYALACGIANWITMTLRIIK
jgi:hypothetical protein